MYNTQKFKELKNYIYFKKQHVVKQSSTLKIVNFKDVELLTSFL